MLIETGSKVLLRKRRVEAADVPVDTFLRRPLRAGLQRGRRAG
jgi:hypothetical protein